MKITYSKYIKEVTVIDPDTNGKVEIAIFKHENGGMFGIDSSYIDQVLDDEQSTIINPFDNSGKTLVNIS